MEENNTKKRPTDEAANPAAHKKQKTGSKAAQIPKAAKTPKSVLDKCVAAIRTLAKAGGSSAQAITKVCLESWEYDNKKAIAKALKAGVEKGLLVKQKASFAVSGEEYEDTSDKVDITEVKEGHGEVVEKGDIVVIAYAGVLEDGSRFDKASLFTFAVGGGEVVKGMDAAVIGMKEGGKRKVKVPSSLGYGKRGSGPEIPPNSNLIFDITLKKIK